MPKANRRLYNFATSTIALTLVLATSLSARPDGVLLPNRFQISDYCVNVLQKNPARTILEAERLTNQFLSFDFEALPKVSGFILHSPTENPRTQTRGVLIPSFRDDFQFYRTEIWQKDFNFYEHISVGYKNLEAYSNRVDQYVLDHIKNNADQNLAIIYNDQRLKAGHDLRNSRWAIHDAVLNVYQDVKGYLSDKDLATLKALNFLSGNYDVFALLDYKAGDKAINLTTEEIQKRLAITIQISYFGIKSYFEPTVQGLLSAAGLPVYMKEDKLPFEYRVSQKYYSKFREEFYKRFAPEETCEMIRYVKFKADLPSEVRDRFLLEAFHQAQENGMRYIIASGDDKTVEVFKRYGFKFYSNLPTEQAKNKEYLYFLDLESSDYQTTFELLTDRANSVKIQYDGAK